MRTYLFGSGIITALSTGMSLLRSLRGGAPLTWRQVLAWASWGITLALSIGTIVETYRERHGRPQGR